MPWLNYHHLLYFWTVGRAGTIAAASRELHLSQPTISTQLKTLEESLGLKLFQRQGRRLALTEAGRTAFRYADDIFRLGRELQEAITHGSAQSRFSVGVADEVPGQIAERLLRPAFEVKDVSLECQRGPLPRLLAKLAVHELDAVLADQPAGADVKVRAFSHLLGESGTSFFARAAQASSLRRNFPRSLDGVAMLMVSDGSTLRRAVDAYFDGAHVRPKVVGEFEDCALMNVFGAHGRGVFMACTAVEDDITRQCDVQVVGRTTEVKQAFYVISVERRLRHPAVLAVAETARKTLLA